MVTAVQFVVDVHFQLAGDAQFVNISKNCLFPLIQYMYNEV